MLPRFWAIVLEIFVGEGKGLDGKNVKRKKTTFKIRSKPEMEVYDDISNVLEDFSSPSCQRSKK